MGVKNNVMKSIAGITWDKYKETLILWLSCSIVIASTGAVSIMPIARIFVLRVLINSDLARPFSRMESHSISKHQSLTQYQLLILYFDPV